MECGRLRREYLWMQSTDELIYLVKALRWIPFMSTDSCSKRIIDAILKEKVMAFMPNYVHIIPMVKGYSFTSIFYSGGFLYSGWSKLKKNSITDSHGSRHTDSLRLWQFVWRSAGKQTEIIRTQSKLQFTNDNASSSFANILENSLKCRDYKQINITTNVTLLYFSFLSFHCAKSLRDYLNCRYDPSETTEIFKSERKLVPIMSDYFKAPHFGWWIVIPFGLIINFVSFFYVCVYAY